MIEQVNQCVTNGNSQTACEIGSVVRLGATTTTTILARGVMTASPLTPIGALTGSVGAYTLIRSGDIGESFGNITTQLVDYMIDRLPSDTFIEPTHPLVIQNNTTSLVFSTQEVTFINELVHHNRQVIRATSDIQNVSGIVSNTSRAVTNQLGESITNHSEAIHRMALRIDDLRLSTTLDTTLPNITARLTSVNEHKVVRPEYVPPACDFGKYVKHDESNGGWVVVFVAVTWKIGGSVSFCIVL
jgi:hypothetical protein